MTDQPEADVSSKTGEPDSVDLGKPATPTESDAATEPPAQLGRNEFGHIAVNPRVVEKIAAVAAIEIPDAGGPGSRGLGRSLPGRRKAGLSSLPKVNAEVDGGLAFLDVELAVRWPAPVAKVTGDVREHLSRFVGELVGLRVSEVNIKIIDLITDVDSARVS